ncbi:hypothetical protein IGI04_005639 [Brassica rapa subsp. trilocularis]|uniref:Class II aldolase/adducin N-terminal domain-containing protein n=1 Tax=Brassica rapa subsp. trilocularis TaxID=1813537 RepID=A0ABQ7NEM0_BRACM|nr:hypothetical protein IGI04_005639 [Brassica rapa subsp. trilocularis]
MAAAEAMVGFPQAYLESREVKETSSLVTELCRHFYTQGWVSGTGGSITIKVHDASIPKPDQLIVMSPSGVQKERMEPEDMYILSANGSVISAPSPKPYPNKLPKCTDCAPLFMKAYEMRNAGAVIHSHGMESCLVTMLNPQAKEFRAECYHYLFDAAIKLHQLGLDAATPEHGPIQRATHSQNQTESTRRCIVLDIEGTTTPITFVTDVLFPYARENVGKHLSLTYDTAETQEDIKLLRSQVEEDLRQGVTGAVPVPHTDEGKDEVIAAIVSNVEAMIKADRKITALKELQGHIWRTGFKCNELKSVVFEDVADALEKWHSSGTKVYIYSSGSRLAQRLLFGNTAYGDLRKYLSGFFDTTIGNKKESRSYKEITETLGVDDPSEILFVTDVYQEATAAKAAGLEAIISIRPGNASLPENHGFKTVTSFSQI